MNRSLLLALLASSLVLPLAARADTVDCSTDCGEGQKLVSFNDGSTVTCNCTAAATMDANVAGPAEVSTEYDNSANNPT